MPSSRVPSYTSGRQKRTAHAFSEIFKQRFLKIIRTPHFFSVLSSTLVHFGASKTHGCTHSQKYLVLRFLKIIRTPHLFAALSSTLVHFGASKTHGCTHSQKYLVLRFLKIRHKPRTFLPSSRVPSYTSGRQKRAVNVFSEIFKQRFLKITRTPHAFIVLSSTLVKCVLGDIENCGNLHLAEKQLSSQTE